VDTARVMLEPVSVIASRVIRGTPLQGFACKTLAQRATLAMECVRA